MKWTISVAGLLKELHGETEHLKGYIKKYAEYDCGFIVPERSLHFSSYAIARYPEKIVEEKDALPSFLLFKAAFETELKNLNSKPDIRFPKCNLELTSVMAGNDGIALKFESSDLENFRKSFTDVVRRCYPEIAAASNWESLLDEKRKNEGKDCTAVVLRIPFTPPYAKGWEKKIEGGPIVVCEKMHLVLSNPYLTNPFEENGSSLLIDLT